MKAGLSKLLESLTPAEQAEVETFAAFLLARRKAGNPQKLEDFSTGEPSYSVLELKGLGKEIWHGIDAQEYVDQERSSWRG
ncbi:MAG: hypothetical protein IH870_03005 [Chloroflexi bacterium]|nr:hypothetical protein [Chloroflexota bacterium]